MRRILRTRLTSTLASRLTNPLRGALKQTIWVVIVALILTSTSNAQGKSKAVTKPTATAATVQPFSLEIDDNATRRGVMITLAVNSFTIIRCPKPPLQIIPGNEEAVVWRETLPGQTDLYISATIPNVTSNLILEFENAKSIVYFQTIGSIGGSRPGSYTQEVMLKPIVFKQELSESQGQIQKLNDEITKLKQQLVEKDKQADEKLTVATSQASNQSDLDSLKTLEQAVYLGKLNTVEANIVGHKGHIRISQATRLIRTAKGSIVIFAVENTSKDIHSIDFVRSSNNKILTTFTNGKALPASLTTYLAVLVQDTFTNSTSPNNTSNTNLSAQEIKEIVFVINGVSVTAKFS